MMNVDKNDFKLKLNQLRPLKFNSIAELIY